MRREVVLLSFLAFSSLLLGCIPGIGPRKEAKVIPTDGVVITDFSSDMPRYEDTEQISLYIEVQNLGGTTASDVDITILGATWEPDETKLKHETGTLKAPDLTVTPPVPGEFESWSTTLSAYDLPEGVVLPVTLTARVEYNYSSNGAVHIPVLSKEEYKRRLQRGIAIPSAPNVTNSAGPIHIDIDPRGLPPVLREARENITLLILLKNVGSGVPINATGGEGMITANLTLLGLNSRFVDCSDYNVTPLPASSTKVRVRLRRGESAKIPCTVELDKPTAHEMLSLLFKSDYRYYTEKQLTVTIVGT